MTNNYRVYLVPMSAPLAVGRQLQVNKTHHLYNIMDDETSSKQMLGDMYHFAIDTGVTGTYQETHSYCFKHYVAFTDNSIEYLPSHVLNAVHGMNEMEAFEFADDLISRDVYFKSDSVLQVLYFQGWTTKHCLGAHCSATCINIVEYILRKFVTV